MEDKSEIKLGLTFFRKVIGDIYEHWIKLHSFNNQQ